MQAHGVLSGWEIDNNCYFGGSVFNVDWANVTLSLWRSTYNKDGASLFNVDPLFTDPRTGTFPCAQAPRAYKAAQSSPTRARPERRTSGLIDRHPQP